MTAPSRAVVGAADACRIGPDSHPGGLAEALLWVLKYQYLNAVWFRCDPDVTYTTAGPGLELGPIEGGEKTLETWHSVVGLAGGLVLTSSPLWPKAYRQFWPRYEQLTPATCERSAVPGYGQSDDLHSFGFTAQRSWARFGVYVLFNTRAEARAVSLRFAEVGLHGPCGVWDFRTGEWLGIFRDEFTVPSPLETMESRHLVFTELPSGLPVPVGSSLHISAGASELDCFRVENGVLHIGLSNAGARSGELVLYSLQKLVLKSFSGVQTACLDGEGPVWHLRIQGRACTSAFELQVGGQ